MTTARKLVEEGVELPFLAVDLPGRTGPADVLWVDEALAALAASDFPGAREPVRDQLRPAVEAAAGGRRMVGWPRAFAIFTPGFFDAVVVHLRGFPASGDAPDVLAGRVVVDADPDHVVVLENTPTAGPPVITGLHHRVRAIGAYRQTVDLLAFVAARVEGDEGLTDVVAASATGDQLTLMRSLPAIRALVSSPETVAELHRAG